LTAEISKHQILCLAKTSSSIIYLSVIYSSHLFLLWHVRMFRVITMERLFAWQLSPRRCSIALTNPRLHTFIMWDRDWKDCKQTLVHFRLHKTWGILGQLVGCSFL